MPKSDELRELSDEWWNIGVESNFLQWEKGYYLLQPVFVGGVECGQVLAVDIQYSDDLPVLPYRDYDFAAGFAAACDVSGEFLDVRHDNRFGALP